MKKRITLLTMAMVIAQHLVYGNSPTSNNCFSIEIWQKLTTAVKEQISHYAKASGNLTLTQGAWFVNDPCQGSNLGGVVWQDYDMDGIKDAAETVGIPDLTVQIFNCSGALVAIDMTDNYGNWYVNPSNISFPVRVEFSGLPGWASSTMKGTGSKTSVQIVSAASCSVNFGVSSPDDYCNSTNPSLAVVCYESGNAFYSSNGNTNKGIVSMPYNSSGITPMGISEVAKIYQVGSVWGMAWQGKNKRLFAANMLKRHSGMGAKGMGGIYVMDYTAGTSAFDTSFTIQGVSPANGGAAIDLGSVTRSGSSDYTLPNSNSTENHDLDAFDKAGKVGFGDADVAPDGNTLWLVNLNQKALISVDISNTTYPGTVNQYLLSNATGIPACTNGVLRPWGLGFNKGKGYLGCVCTAETNGTSANLQAFVLSFDPANPTAFTSEISFPLNYTREKAVDFPTYNLNIAGNWQPWVSTWAATGYTNNPPSETGYPQPILSDIDFTDDGAMVLGFADRFGFQMGYENYIPVSGDNSLTSGDVAGDIIKVCRVDGAWVLEGGTGCSESDNNTKSSLGTDGPSGTGEFFYGDYFDDTDVSPSHNHNETFMGGLGVLKGTNELLAGHYDPVNGGGYAFDLGFIWHNSSTGARTDQFRVVDTGPAATKGNGFGDLAFLCAAAPVQIGNIVWNDANQNGSQDPCEEGMNGIAVRLYKMSGGTTTLVAATTTASINGQDGSWYFSDYQQFGNGYDTLTPGKMYFVTLGEGGQFDTATGMITLAGSAYQLTLADTGLGANSDMNDADASIANDPSKPFNGFPVLSITIGNEGYVNHSLDFGLTEVLPPFIGNDLSTCHQSILEFIAYPNNANMTDSIPGDWVVHAALGSSVFYSTQPGDSTLSVTFLNGTGLTQVDTVIFIADNGFSDTSLVTVFPNQTTLLNAEICEGETMSFNGENLNFSGTYYETWTDIHGCDSLVVLELTVLSAPFINIYYEGCAGDGHSYTANGTVYNEANPIGEEVMSAFNGCDSTVAVEMVFYPTAAGLLNYEGCTGDGFSLEVNGHIYNESNPNGMEMLLTQQGCDSVLTVNLVFHSPSTHQINYNGCSGDGYSIIVNGSVYNQANPIGTEFLTNYQGCDSTILINLDFNLLGLTGVESHVTSPGNNDGSINLTVTGGDTPYTYDWDIDGAETPDNDPQDANGLTAGTYTVTVTDAGGCTETASFLVVEPNCNLMLTAVATPASCNAGTNGAIDLTVSGGSEPYGYDWSNDGPESFNNDPQDLMGLPAGSYTVTVEDNNGCTATLTTMVSQPTALNLIGTPHNTTSVGASDGSVDISVAGGTQPYSFDWSNDGAENPDNDTEDIYDLAAGTYQVTVSDANGCTKTGGYTVSNPLVFDLALRKTLASGQSSVVQQGDDVNFTITVFNQGQLTATNVLVLDYLPANMTFNAGQNPGWINFGAGPTLFIPSLGSGASITKNLKLKVAANAPNGIINNYAEISSANDADPNTTELPTDIDSDPDAFNLNDPGGLPGGPADDVLTGNGMGAPGSNDPATDEDDHDGAAIEVNIPSVSLGNLVFHDLTNDGLFNTGDLGLVGVEVELYDAGPDHVKGTSDDELTEIQATNDQGEYLFDGLEEGFYFVKLNGNGIPSGFVSSTGGGVFDNDANGPVEPAFGTNLNQDHADDGTQMGVMIMSEVIELSLGDEPNGNSNLTVDFGLYHPSALPTLSLGNLVFLDFDNDGLFNNNDVGVEDVEVELYDAGPDQEKGTSDDEFVGGQATNGFGEYLFAGLPEGFYYVWLNGGGIPANHVSSTGDGIYDNDGNGAVEPAFGTNDNVDNRDDGTQMGIGIMSEVFELALGEEPDGNDNYTVDFGLYEPQTLPTLSLGNLVFFDYENDGIYNNNDGGIEDVEVELYDAGPDQLKGTVDDEYLGAQSTNGFGAYLFTGLEEGFYFVKLNGTGIPANHVSSTGEGIFDNNGDGPFEPAVGTNNNFDNNDDGTQMGAMVMSEVIQLTLGEEPDGNENFTVDFGFYQPQAQPVLSLGNLVFLDLDNDGLFNNNDIGIEDVAVDLFSAGNDHIKGTPDDQYFGTQTTSATGTYLFNGLIEGFYYLKLNGNGIPTNHLSSTGGGIYDNDGAGFYEPATGTNDNVDDSDDGTQMGAMIMSEVIELTLGEEPDGDFNTTVDFGLYEPQPLPTLSLGNLVFLDYDNDGLLNNNDSGVEDVEVELYDAGPDQTKGTADDEYLGTQTTNGFGEYLFTGLSEGFYYLKLNGNGIPANHVSATGDGVFDSDGVGVFEPATGTNNNADNSDDGTQMGLMVMSGVLELTIGEEPDGDENLTVDFGLYEPQQLPAFLGNFVWFDYDHDGQQDPSEPGVEGVEVNLMNVGGDGVKGGNDDFLVETQYTPSNGGYYFQNIIPGKYYLQFDLGSLPAHYHPTVQNQGSDLTDSDVDAMGMTPVVTLAQTEENITLDFGIEPELASIGDFVWYDYNNDGQQTPGEPGVWQVLVSLYDLGDDHVKGGGDDNLVSTDVTNSDGYYAFNDLEPGDYYLSFNLFSLPVDYSPVAPGAGGDDTNDSDANAMGMTEVISLEAGQNNMDVDLGIYSSDFDLALTKSLSPGQPAIVDIGDQIAYTIAVSNEGNNPAFNIKVVDNFPVGMKLSPNNQGWTLIDPQTAEYTIPGPVYPGETVFLEILLTVHYGTNGQQMQNIAEVTSVSDGSGNPITDIDSTPDNNNPNEDDTDNVGIELIPHDPTGWVYCDKTGKIITGGTVSVTGPNGIPNSQVIILHNGINGYYEFYTDGTPGVYTISYSHPLGYPLGLDCAAQAGPFDPTGLPDPIVFGVDTVNAMYISDTDCASNPYYLSFSIEPGDPNIHLNNLPVSCTYIGSIVCEDTNHNDLADAGDLPLAGETVYLYDCADLMMPIASTLTDASGHYRFDGMLPGNYVVGFDPGANTRFVSTGNINQTGFSDCITLAWGECDTTKTVCLYTCPTINAGSDIDHCSNANSSQLDANLTHGTGNFTWAPAGGLNNATIEAPIASPATTTTYIVNFNDGFGCVDSDTIRVNVGSSTPFLANMPFTNQTVQCTAISDTPTFGDACDANLTIVSDTILTNLACGFVREITWIATNDEGNSASFTQTLTVEDTQAPTLSANHAFFGAISDGDTIYADCSMIPSLDSLGFASSDNCSVPTVNFTENVIAGNCQVDGFYQLRNCGWTSTDACGNVDSLFFVVVITDNDPPVLPPAPANTTVSCSAVPVPPSLAAIDNCDATPTVTVDDLETFDINGCLLQITRTWLAVDDCGNASNAVQTITVVDNSFPILVGVPADISLSCNLPLPLVPVVTATDNCDSDVPVIYSSTTNGNPATGCYSVTRTWTATDNCGNTSSSSQIITVSDTTPPVLAGVPANSSISCTTAIPVPPAVTATDNCDASVSVTMTPSFIGDPTTGCFTLVRTWTATDDCGNTATAVQSIVVFDNQGPVLVGVPASATYACGTPVPGPPAVTAIDNCDAIQTVNYNQTIVGNLASGCYVLTRTWSATDDCGNLTSQSQVITVQDNIAPTLSAQPANISLTCLSQVPPVPTISATDNCDSNVPVIFSVATIGNPLGCNFQILRTWATADDCGNAVAHTQTITVNDNTPPVLAGVPANLFLNCSNPVPAAPNVTASDDCDASVTVTMTPTYLGNPNSGCYILTRTWTATDDCGNTATAAQTITVTDTEAPNFVGLPIGGNANCDNIPGANLTATDNCDNQVTVTFSDQVQSNVNGCVTQIVRTWTATDDCGNTRIASRTFNLTNTDAPVITILEPAMAGVQDGDVLHLECDDLVSLSAASAMAAPDCCGDPIIEFFEFVTPTNCQANGYVATMVCGWVATDCCGNADSLFFTVFVEDNTPPELINVPASLILPVGSTLPAAPIVVALDNCDNLVPVSYNSTTTGPADNQLTTRVWSASDDCGNVAIATQTILITNDNQAPLIGNVPPDITIEGPISNLPGDDQGVTVSDNLDDSPELVFFSEKTGGLCCYIVTNTWIATDDFGNTTIATQTITVTDSQAPVISGNVADVSATCSLGDVPVPQLSATDNCAGQVVLNFTVDTTQLACGYQVLRTWAFSDECGNTATATQTITLEDNEAPSFAHGSAPNLAFYASQNAVAIGGINLSIGDEISPNQPWSIGNQLMPGMEGIVVDNCTDGAEIRFRLTNVVMEDHPCQQDWKAYFEVLDACGNVADNDFIVIAAFVDDVEPVFANLPQDLTLDCESLSPPVALSATDNSGGVVAIEFNEVVSNGCPATITRTWTAKDGCGNSAIAAQIVSLTDNDAPILENVPASLAANCGDVPPVALNVTASDNCLASLPVNFTESIVGTGCSYTITRTWTAADACGNAAIKKQYIWVADHETPTIETVLVPEITISCDEVVPVAANLTVSDNCDNSPQIGFTETIESQNGCAYTIHRVWTVTDACGNTAFAGQDIHVDDLASPVFATIPVNLTVECDNIPAAENLTATDNCDSFVDVAFEEITTSASNVGCPYFIVRTWTATDDCGNETQINQVITVVDTELPVLSASPADLQVHCASEIPPAETLTATDNCGQNMPVTLLETVSGTGCNKSVKRTWTATDACGNTATAEQTILVQDTKPPVFTSLPSDLHLLCSDPLPAPLTLVANDNCDQQLQMDYVQTLVPTNCGQQLLRTWTATDDCGNATTVAQTITLVDNLAPTAAEPDDMVVNCGTAPPVATPGFTDNCDANLTIQFAEVTTVVACGENIQRTWTATDDCGNSATVSQLIELRDLTAPTLSFNHPLLQGLSNNDTLVLGCDNSMIFNESDVLATDNCSNLNLQLNMETFNYGNCISDGYVVEAKFKWTASDDCGNTADLALNVKLVDNEAPVFENLPDVIVVNCGQPAPNFTTPDVVDGCSNATLSFASQTHPTAYGQDIVGTWSANDDCGNISTLIQTMQIYSVGAAQLLGVPNDTTVNTAIGETLPMVAQVSAADNCSGTNLPVDFQENTQQLDACTTLVERSWSVVGLNGITVTATQDITVVNGVQFVASMTPDSCSAGNGTLVLSPASLNYTWSDGGSGAVRNDLPAGSYQVTATNSAGCSSTSTVQVAAACNCEVALVEKINFNTTPCGENKGKATIFLLQNEADYVYEWSPNLGNPNLIGNAHNLLPAGHYQVTIKYNSLQNCASTVEFDIHDDCPACVTQYGDAAVAATVGPTVTNEVCLPIPYGMLSAYEVRVNGQVYSGMLEPCDPHDVVIYDYSNLPVGGPYSVAWQHDGTSFYTLVDNMAELAAAMGYVDPQGLWYNDAANTELVSQKFNGNYGQLSIRKHATGAVMNEQPIVTSSNLGAMLTLLGGNQVVSYTNLSSGCSGTVEVNFTEEGAASAATLSPFPVGQEDRAASDGAQALEAGLVIHNAFSPNGDGINDYFKIKGLEAYPNNKLQVFNSLGRMVFKTVGYLNDWGGSWGQNNLPDGTYYYLLEDGKGAKFTGFVQIKR